MFVLLGSKKLEEEFDELSPEESKRRLALLVKKMDVNADGFVTAEELTQWILTSFQLVLIKKMLHLFLGCCLNQYFTNLYHLKYC